MGFYKDASGQFVITSTQPVGGTLVPGPASSRLSDIAIWLRLLDAPGDTAWHPANYYGDEFEDTKVYGYSNAVVFAYKRSDTVPTDNPGEAVYDFTIGGIPGTGFANEWQPTIPDGSAPLYVTRNVAAGQADSVLLLPQNWTTPELLAASSTSYWLTTSAAIVKKNSAGDFKPSALLFTAKSQTGSDAPIDYAGRFKIYENDSTIPVYTSTVDEISKTFALTASVESVRVELYKSGGTTQLLDEGTVVVVFDSTMPDNNTTAVRCYVKTNLGSLLTTPATLDVVPSTETGDGGWGVTIGGPNAGWSPIPSTLPGSFGFVTLPPPGAWGATLSGVDSEYSTLPIALDAGESLYQCDGTYYPDTGHVTWDAPYLASLKVGDLSAVATKTGTLTVSGVLTVDAIGAIQSGKTGFADNIHSGFFLGSDSGIPKFKIGDADYNLSWDGSALKVVGDVVETGNIKIDSVTKVVNTALIAPTQISVSTQSARDNGTAWEVINGDIALPGVDNVLDRGVAVLLFDVYMQPGTSANNKWWFKAQQSTDYGNNWFDTGTFWQIKVLADSGQDFQDIALIGYVPLPSVTNPILFRLQAYHNSSTTKYVGDSIQGICQFTIIEAKR